MNDLLLICMSLSISGSLVALALILLRPILRRFSKTWQYYIWLLVILRLLIPFSPEVSLVGSLFQQTEAHFTIPYTPVEDFLQNKSLDLSGTSDDFLLENSDMPNNATTAFLLFLWSNHILGVLWIAVAMLFLFRKIYGYKQLTKAVRRESEIIVDGQINDALQIVLTTMGRHKKISVCINPFVRAPMLIGVLRPMIVLPVKAISPAELTCIFRHELTHYRRMDFLYKWLAEIAVCIHWFNPLAYWVRKQINKDCEFSCDEAVISALGDGERRTYGDTLLNSIEINHIRRQDVVSLSLNEDGSLIKERLCAIMRYKRKSKRVVFIAVVLTSILLCGTIFAGCAIPVGGNGLNQQPGTVSVQSKEKATQTVVYNSVEIRQYEGENGHTYIHNTKTNNTSREIAGYQRGMLAFDKEGNPLKIDWWSIDSELDGEHFYLYEDELSNIAGGTTADVVGGWSLNLMGKDQAVDKIAFVLYCDKEITFEDGTVWKNPDFANWRSTYEGKKIDVNILASYYPYEHKIEF